MSVDNQDNRRAYPVFVVKTGTMKPKQIRRLEKMGCFIVVESDEPDAIRFLEPPPDANVPAQAAAALSLFRVIKDFSGYQIPKTDLMKWFIDRLIDERPKQVPRVKVKG